jgi:hypothetical protein
VKEKIKRQKPSEFFVALKSILERNFYLPAERIYPFFLLDLLLI